MPLFLKLRHIKKQKQAQHPKNSQYCFDKINIHAGNRHKPPLLPFRFWFSHALGRQKEKLTSALLLELICFPISISGKQESAPNPCVVCSLPSQGRRTRSFCSFLPPWNIPPAPEFLPITVLAITNLTNLPWNSSGNLVVPELWSGSHTIWGSGSPAMSFIGYLLPISLPWKCLCFLNTLNYLRM